MARTFDWVGVVRKAKTGDGHVLGEVPGKVALVIADPEAGECLGYFPCERRPRVGARIGARGQFVEVDVPPDAVPPEARELVRCGGTPVQFQLDVATWTVVSDDFDPLFD